MITLFTDKKDCCGCTACMNICPKSAITMQSDTEGFLYPVIDISKCIECGLCKRVCGFQNGYEGQEREDLPEIYAVKHKDEQVRMNSTSGGVFTALSDFMLQQEGVIFGASFDDNMVVCHQRADTKKEREHFRGSKYVQSDLRDVFKQIKQLLKEGRYILFTGTPCQVSGLNSYLKNTNTNKLFVCDIVCHGVPSPLMFKEYINLLERKNNSKIIKYYCRDKVNGWHSHTERAVYANGTEDFKSTLSTVYRELFYSHNVLRPACHNCKYTNFNRPSDITFADFWGIEKSMTEFDDNKGISLVLVNTPKGKELFKGVESNLEIRESNTKDCLQPQLQYPSKPATTRQEFWRDYNAYGFEYVIKKYAGYNTKTRIKAKIISILKKVGLFEVIHKVMKSCTNSH